jgi:carbon storage regulator
VNKPLSAIRKIFCNPRALRPLPSVVFPVGVAVYFEDEHFKEGFLMLVLTRKLGECIYIGNNTQVTVVAIQGQQIRLGINAPKVVPILRGELMWAEVRQPGETTPGPPVVALADGNR